MAPHELKAEVMAYSSVVGSGVLLFNERGQMLGQIAFLCQADELREKAFQERLAGVISNAINAAFAATQPTPQEAAKVLLRHDENGGRKEVYDACENRIKVYKFDAALRAIAGEDKA
ncbi:hypothetical protein BV394_02175 [Brevirhabdus pacifica]|uniref:Uncharacterized protein n=1 Tax=Brevirhabdus pacifica TaxID=1267768 RepID=A0A1U7DFG2_9RHOB|nr:hypothetical protein [Brevirhabdus pacifica]APX88685.1 hypothetical protein BV394_02175 [Brevirhabdus pacifica]OWU79950.1 hypothetical protein ATO5_02855 [Loktanella sp. 22II-4b]PJJ86806.1 hypothetical protein CLV77_1364 [Brevirhabdus pacifica]